MTHYRNVPRGSAVVGTGGKHKRGMTVLVPALPMNRAQRRRAEREAKRNRGGK